MFRALPLAALLVVVAGCNTDPAVFVEPSVKSPKLAVMGGALGVSVTGSFELAFHLGARAADSSSVTVGEFEIVTGDDKSPIVSPLPLSSNEHFPVTVDQDSDVSVDFTFDSGKNPLPVADEGPLCAPAGVVIKGTIQDSLRGSATPVFSPTFDPSGC
jgi:hypothetical protein